jgi:hypothetical protein
MKIYPLVMLGVVGFALVHGDETTTETKTTDVKKDTVVVPEKTVTVPADKKVDVNVKQDPVKVDPKDSLKVEIKADHPNMSVHKADDIK